LDPSVSDNERRTRRARWGAYPFSSPTGAGPTTGPPRVRRLVKMAEPQRRPPEDDGPQKMIFRCRRDDHREPAGRPTMRVRHGSRREVSLEGDDTDRLRPGLLCGQLVEQVRSLLSELRQGKSVHPVKSPVRMNRLGRRRKCGIAGTVRGAEVTARRRTAGEGSAHESASHDGPDAPLPCPAPRRRTRIHGSTAEMLSVRTTGGDSSFSSGSKSACTGVSSALRGQRPRRT
jgi:hypothetical protein